MYNDFPLFVYLLCDIEPLDLFDSCITKTLYHTIINKSRHSLVYHPQLVAVYHQHEVLYLIKPQVIYTLTRDEIQPHRG